MSEKLAARAGDDDPVDASPANAARGSNAAEVLLPAKHAEKDYQSGPVAMEGVSRVADGPAGLGKAEEHAMMVEEIAVAEPPVDVSVVVAILKSCSAFDVPWAGGETLLELHAPDRE